LHNATGHFASLRDIAWSWTKVFAAVAGFNEFILGFSVISDVVIAT
jgi:hypothetical protein